MAEPTRSATISPRACALAIVVAFLSGLIASLALRDAEHVADRSVSQTAESAAGDASAIDTLSWRVPVAFNTKLPALGDNSVWVRDALAANTNGTIHWQIFEPGEIVSAFAITDAVANGKIDAGYTWLGYDQGRIPASVLLAAVPFGMEPWEYMAWWYEGGGQQLGEALYQRRGIHPVLCGLIGPETAGWFREPITDLGDVEGLKIRFAGLGGKVLQRLGASVTMIPGSDLFQALEEGAIDATEYSLPIVDRQLGFDRIARFNYFPGWHQTFTAGHLLVGADTWNSLGPATRAMIEHTCTAGVARNLARAEALQGPVIEAFPDAGVVAGRLPDALLEELRRVTQEVLDEEAAADAEFAEILASQRAFSDSYGTWKRLAYLRRDF